MIATRRMVGTVAVAAALLAGSGVSWGAGFDTGGQTGGHTPGQTGDPPGTGSQQGGIPAGLQRPGDLTGDGLVDISDAIRLLSYLFLGGAETPCSAALADFNGDRALDVSDPVAMLSWLFLGGNPHALGEECVPIVGCADACADG